MEPDDTLRVPSGPVQCRHCGHYCNPEDTHCPNCGAELKATARLETQNISDATRYALAPSHHPTANTLLPKAPLILQILPSAICIPLSLKSPVILGRKGTDHEHPIIDLTEFHAHELGVSRHHCLLQRIDDQIIAIDLDSSNHSFLNNILMASQQEYALTHKDQLILGRLYINILFGLAVHE